MDVREEYARLLMDGKRTAGTVATVWRTALKTVFAWGVGEKLIKANPFKGNRHEHPRRL
jgi:hypothetical protein